MKVYNFYTPHGDVTVEIADRRQSFQFSHALDHFLDEDKRYKNGEARSLYRKVFTTVIEQAAAGVDISTTEYRSWVFNTIERHAL